MPSKSKSSATSKASTNKIGRLSDSGKFVVVKQATKSKRFSEGVLRDAVRKVNTAKGSPRS